MHAKKFHRSYIPHTYDKHYHNVAHERGTKFAARDLSYVVHYHMVITWPAIWQKPPRLLKYRIGSNLVFSDAAHYSHRMMSP